MLQDTFDICLNSMLLDTLDICLNSMLQDTFDICLNSMLQDTLDICLNSMLQDTFDICRKTFSSGDEMQRMGLGDKVELFFHDYSLVPLFAYENYIGAIPYSSRSDICCCAVYSMYCHYCSEVIEYKFIMKQQKFLCYSQHPS